MGFVEIRTDWLPTVCVLAYTSHTQTHVHVTRVTFPGGSSEKPWVSSVKHLWILRVKEFSGRYPAQTHHCTDESADVRGVCLCKCVLHRVRRVTHTVVRTSGV